jgi:hypothetical protein
VSNQADDTVEESSQSTSATTQYLDITDTTSIMIIIIYSLLVIGVVWKFIRYMRENRNLRFDEIS